MSNSMIINGQSYDKLTIKSAMGNLLASKHLNGVHLSDEQVDELIQTALTKNLLKKDWIDARTKNKPSPDVASSTRELIKNCSFDLAYTNDADLAALYLYKIKNAKERGIIWDLSLTELRNILKRKRCYYSGSEIVRNATDRNRPTLDRIDNKKGYTKENTVVCSFWVNQLKNELFENPRSEILTDMKTLLKILKNIQK